MVDSNVLLDVLTEDARWFDWSSRRLAEFAEERILLINPIVYAEVSVGFSRIEDLEEALSPAFFRRDPLPYEAGFLAGKAFLKYRRRGGKRERPLPDFFIGAHAAISDLLLLTRDPVRYRTYFPTVELAAP